MKTGQKKYDARFGWGVVREVTDNCVKVQFAIDVCEYTLEGKDNAHELVALLRDEKYHLLTKEQMEDLFDAGSLNVVDAYEKMQKGEVFNLIKFEDYYNETYGL
jgi:hypothetical protein